MEFTQLQYFRVLARHQHFTRAARELFITQPTLSRTIARLESELGCKLFERNGNSVRLNESGANFLTHVEQVFSHIEDGKQELTELNGGARGPVTLVSDYAKVLARPIAKFLLGFPNVNVSQLNRDARQMQLMLEDKTADFAVSTFPILSPKIEWVHIFTDRFGIIMSAKHKMADRKSISVSELRNERFVLNNSASDMYHVSINCCKEAGFTPNICFSGDQPYIIAELVSENFGVSFMSGERFSARKQLTALEKFDKEIVFVPLENPTCYRAVGIAALRNHKLAIAARNLYAYVYNNLLETGKSCPYCIAP